MTFANHFRALTRFSGRETRSEFWPWAGAVVGLTMVITTFGMAISLASALGSPADPSPAPDFSGVFISMGVAMVFAVVLLAAAVARRLKDAGWSPLWGLGPLPFAAFSVLTFPRMMTNFGSGTEADMDLFMAVFISNGLYNAALLFLIILLILPSRQAAPRRPAP